MTSIDLVTDATAPRPVPRRAIDFAAVTGAWAPNMPWAAFQRVLFAALVSQSTWWGAIAIGFLTNANRHS